MDLSAMESTKKQTKPTPSADHAAGGDDEDLISGLLDDVLLRILGLVADAKAVVRTGVLSRRWRHLWTRAPVLFFRPEFESAGDVELYVAFVSNVLARRAQSDDNMEFLGIPFLMDQDCVRGQEQLVPPSIKAAEEWIRFAVQHAVTCFRFMLRLPLKERLDGRDDHEKEKDDHQEEEVDGDDNSDDDDDEEEEEEEEGVNSDNDEEEEEVDIDDSDNEDEEDQRSEEGDDPEMPVIDLDELPRSGRLEIMYLTLGNVRVRLPSTVVFESLMDLTLEFIELAAGSGHLFSRLLSSVCCPRLERLSMLYINFKRAGTKQLVLEADALLELSLDNMEALESLELKTPNLLDLELEECSGLKTLKISAPKLEELACLRNSWRVDVQGDFPCVWRLKVNLCSHLWTDVGINDAGICLLQRCSSASAILVDLEIPSQIERRNGVDLITDKVPQLPHVTALEVNVHPIYERHYFGDGVAGLLTRFNSLRYLGVQLHEVPGSMKRDEFYSEDADENSAFVCDHPDDWSSHEISLAQLEEAAFRGLTGAGCELRFLQFVLASTTDLKKVTISFSVNYRLEGRIDDFRLMLFGHGTWTACHDDDVKSYEWRPSGAHSLGEMDA